jgi:hypothetical protein
MRRRHGLGAGDAHGAREEEDGDAEDLVRREARKVGRSGLEDDLVALAGLHRAHLDLIELLVELGRVCGADVGELPLNVGAAEVGDALELDLELEIGAVRRGVVVHDHVGHIDGRHFSHEDEGGEHE